jgi:hypothetical protein
MEDHLHNLATEALALQPMAQVPLWTFTCRKCPDARCHVWRRHSHGIKCYEQYSPEEREALAKDPATINHWYEQTLLHLAEQDSCPAGVSAEYHAITRQRRSHQLVTNPAFELASAEVEYEILMRTWRYNNPGFPMWCCNDSCPTHKCEGEHVRLLYFQAVDRFAFFTAAVVRWFCSNECEVVYHKDSATCKERNCDLDGDRTCKRLDTSTFKAPPAYPAFVPEYMFEMPPRINASHPVFAS